ncbi:MAG: transposase [Thermoanaerobaculia bacterium]|nr:transposase [Thermoanaerobaculia bacterium]
MVNSFPPAREVSAVGNREIFPARRSGAPIAAALEIIPVAERGEAGWPPLALFNALLIAVWHDLSDVKLADALDDRASFRRFCGFSRFEPTPERTAFVRFRRLLVARELDRVLFDRVNRALRARAVTVKTGTLVDATVIASASAAISCQETNA